MNTKKQSTKLSKSQKPTEYDIHLKYVCKKCGQSHWLSYREASTKNYKVVCDCEYVFGVKLVIGFDLKYKDSNTEKQKSIPQDVLEKGLEHLKTYGFNDIESKDILTKAFIDNPTNDLLGLIKQALIFARG